MVFLYVAADYMSIFGAVLLALFHAPFQSGVDAIEIPISCFSA